MSDEERHNDNGKGLVLTDGMGMVSSGAMAITDKRHIAIRNAIESHRVGGRVPLAIPTRIECQPRTTNSGDPA